MIAVAANGNSSRLNHQVKEGHTISGGVFGFGHKQLHNKPPYNDKCTQSWSDEKNMKLS